MKTRILSGAAAILLLAVLMVLGREAIGAAVFVLALIGIHEFYGAVESGGYKPVKILGYLFCLPLLYLGIFGGKGTAKGITEALTTLEGISLGVFLLLLVLFCVSIFMSGRYNMIDISITLFGILYVDFLFSFVILTRNMENGYLYIWLILIGAFVTDTFAYFTGVSIGRTKILPAVSPKKSLEGSIGGVIGCIAVMYVFGQFAGAGMAGIPVYHYIILGALCGVVSQIGDWAASAVKRFVKIKDFGRLMPGHGGVLDRFDSILFTAPVVYFYISLFIE